MRKKRRWIEVVYVYSSSHVEAVSYESSKKVLLQNGGFCNGCIT
jgi:hypothetical protein